MPARARGAAGALVEAVDGRFAGDEGEPMCSTAPETAAGAAAAVAVAPAQAAAVAIATWSRPTATTMKLKSSLAQAFDTARVAAPH